MSTLAETRARIKELLTAPPYAIASDLMPIDFSDNNFVSISPDGEDLFFDRVDEIPLDSAVSKPGGLYAVVEINSGTFPDTNDVPQRIQFSVIVVADATPEGYKSVDRALSNDGVRRQFAHQRVGSDGKGFFRPLGWQMTQRSYGNVTKILGIINFEVIETFDSLQFLSRRN